MRRGEAVLNHWAWTATGLTGVAYGVLKYFVANPDPNSRAPHPWASPVLAAHVLAAPFAVFALGMVYRRHAVARLSAGQSEGRSTGGVLTWLAIPLAFSGYVVQVLTHEAARRWIGWGHAAAGLVFAIGYLAHPKAAPEPEDQEVNCGRARPGGTSGPA